MKKKILFYSHFFLLFFVLLSCNKIFAQCSVTASANPTPICIGSSTQLSASPTGGTTPYTYLWSNSLGTTKTVNASPTITITYTVTITDKNSCSAKNTVSVIVNARPSVTVSASPSTICSGASSQLSAIPSGGTAPYTYLWSNSLGTIQTVNVSPTTNTTYSVTVTDNKNCSNTNTTNNIALTVNTRPSVTASASPSTICSGASSQLSAAPSGGTTPYTYLWSNSLGTTQTINASPTTNSTYSVTVTDLKGCSATNTVIINVNALPMVTAGGETICIGLSATLTADGANTYSWNNSLSGSTITVNPTISTTYSVTGTDVNNCSNTTQAIVTVNPILTAGGETICSGFSATITAGGSCTSYTWSNSLGNSSTITVNPTISTTYTVKGSDGVCTNTAQAIVTVNPLPTANAQTSAASACNGNAVTLSANAGAGTTPYTYAWSSGATPANNATPTATINANTIYTVTITDSKNCTATSSVNVSMWTLPAITASGGTICLGNTQTISANGATIISYAWSNSNSNASQTVSPTTKTTYTVTGTDANNCLNTATTTVIVNTLPTANAQSSAASACNGYSVTLSANAGAGTTPYTYA